MAPPAPLPAAVPLAAKHDASPTPDVLTGADASSYGGVPVTDLLPEARLAELVQRTRDGGAEIVGLLKTGSAFYAPSASAVAMVAAILRDEKRILPACVRLEGEYGIDDVFLGVPAKLGENGVEEVIELKLLPDELDALRASADKVRAGCSVLMGQ